MQPLNNGHVREGRTQPFFPFSVERLSSLRDDYFVWSVNRMIVRVVPFRVSRFHWYAYRLLRRRGHATTVDCSTWSIMQMRRRMLLQCKNKPFQHKEPTLALVTVRLLDYGPFLSLNASTTMHCGEKLWPFQKYLIWLL